MVNINIQGKMQRKGWLRIVEATIGIILILGAVLIYYQINKVHVKDNFAENLPVIAAEISRNDTLRSEIVYADVGNSASVALVQQDLQRFLTNRISRQDLNFSTKICNINVECKLDFSALNVTNFEGNSYDYELIIGVQANMTSFNVSTTPKKVRISVWKVNA